MRIEGNCKYGEALSSATNIRKIIFRLQTQKRQEIFLSLFFIAGKCRRGTGRAARILYAVFANKETVGLGYVPITVYVLVSEKKRGEIGWPANSQLPD